MNAKLKFKLRKRMSFIKKNKNKRNEKFGMVPNGACVLLTLINP